jgi:hypothetical protein
MAVATGTFKTYEAKGIREELSNIIYNISPEDTPFMSNAGRGKISSVLFEFQQDSLAAPDAANQQLEGDDPATFDAVTATVRMTNYAQISRKTLSISGTEEVVDKAGRKSELAYQQSKKGSELKRDMEGLLLSNTAANAGAAGTARKTAGLPAWVKTNTSKGAGAGADPVYTTLPNNARTDGTGRAGTEALLKTVIQLQWAQGGECDTIMVGGVQKQAISAYAGIATKTYQQTAKVASAIIGAADVYVSDFGIFAVVPNRFQRAIDQWVLNFELIDVVFLRHMFVKKIADTGDSSKRLMLVEYGLKVKQEAGLGLVTDVTS